MGKFGNISKIVEEEIKSLRKEGLTLIFNAQNPTDINKIKRYCLSDVITVPYQHHSWLQLHEKINRSQKCNRGRPLACQFKGNKTEKNIFCDGANIATELIRRFKIIKMLNNSFYVNKNDSYLGD